MFDNLKCIFNQCREIKTIYIFTATTIDIESLQNRLLKVCYMPATSTGLNRLLFLLQTLTVLMKQTRQVVRAIKYSILLRCIWLQHFCFQNIALSTLSELPSTKLIFVLHKDVVFNRRAHIRHQHRKTTGFSCHRCLINTGVEKMNKI